MISSLVCARPLVMFGKLAHESSGVSFDDFPTSLCKRRCCKQPFSPGSSGGHGLSESVMLVSTGTRALSSTLEHHFYKRLPQRSYLKRAILNSEDVILKIVYFWKEKNVFTLLIIKDQLL